MRFIQLFIVILLGFNSGRFLFFGRIGLLVKVIFFVVFLIVGISEVYSFVFGHVGHVLLVFLLLLGNLSQNTFVFDFECFELGLKLTVRALVEFQLLFGG